ncbi:hypothetical protein ACHAO8_011571 [Botrytis cinerea]
MTVEQNQTGSQDADVQPGVEEKVGQKFETRDDDVFIALMGVTGVGTQVVTVYGWNHPNGRRIFFIDTPGFDDTKICDTEILKTLVDFLASGYKSGIKLTGIVYLHRISDNRMPGSAVRNLEVFEALCGPDCFRNVALATTFWGSGPPPPQYLAFETQLQNTENFWKPMIKHGSRVFRQNNGLQSAMAIVDHFLTLKPVVMQVQREIVDDGASLLDTEAGRRVNQDLLDYQDKIAEDLKIIQEKFERELEESGHNNQLLADELARLREEHQQTLNAQASLASASNMEVPWWKPVLETIGNTALAVLVGGLGGRLFKIFTPPKSKLPFTNLPMITPR